MATMAPERSASTMKAIVCRHYGTPDVLRLEDVEIPTVADDEVLIRVRAASANPIDKVIGGRPYVIRALTGLRKPKNIFVGRDLSGVVEAIGSNVTHFRPGDEVFGAGRGAFAEYASARETNLARKPPNVTFEEAAAVPIAAITALQGLRDKAALQSGQDILINGAGGGVGTFAVQIAKSLGARVTAVCSTANVDLVRSLGADDVTDYTRDDFTHASRRHDVFFDCVGNRSLTDCCRALHPKGLYVAVGAKTLRHLLWVRLSSPLVSQKVVFVMAKLRNAALVHLAELLESRKIVPVIGRRFSLPEAAEALRYVETGHARGKAVVTI